MMSIAAPMLVERTERGDRMFMTMLQRHCDHVLDTDTLVSNPNTLGYLNLDWTCQLLLYNSISALDQLDDHEGTSLDDMKILPLEPQICHFKHL